MSGDRKQSVLRHRSLRKWAAMFAIVALTAWLVQFATHLHIDEDLQAAQSSHFCAFCAAFAVGAPAPVAVSTVAKLRPTVVSSSLLLIAPGLQRAHFYLSRGPPAA
jgi:hypothetical protein